MDGEARVLVVGDGAAATTATERLANDDRFTPVRDGDDDAVVRLHESSAECVVCEHGEGVDALALTDRIRAVDADVPVVLYAAAGSEELASRAFAAGVTDYLRHDADAEVLSERVSAAVETYRDERELRETASRYRSLVEQNLVGIYVIRDYVFEYVNPQLADLFGYEQSALEGKPVEELVDPSDRDRVLGNLRRRIEGQADSLQYGFTARRKSGEPIEVEVHGTRVDRDGETVVMGTLIDRTRERRRTDALAALYGAAEELSRATDPEAVCTVGVESAKEILGLHVGLVALAEGDRLVPTAATAEATDYFDDLPTFSPGDDPAWSAYSDGGVVAEHDADAVAPDADSVVVASLGSHGVFVGVVDADDGLDGSRLELLRLLAANVEATLDRVRQEAQVARLHEATRRLMSARDEGTVADVGTETAREILGLSVCAVYFKAEGADELVPAAWTDDAERLFGEMPLFRPGESLAWRTYESGEAVVADDIRDYEGIHNPDTDIRSEMILPLGDHGVFLSGSRRPGAFDEGLVTVAKVLAANVESALDRADREQQLREREAEFRRQSERLGEFASVVSHDLRNPLGVAQGHLELLKSEVDSPHFDAIESAHERMRTLIEDLLTLARQGQAVGETEAVDFRFLVSQAWTAVEGGTLDAPDDLGTLDCDEDRVRELLVNLFSNSVEHGSTSSRASPDDAVDHAGPDVTVSVGRLDDGGFYVADDGPGIEPDRRETVFERGETTADEGTGFGLAIVRSIAEAHGWSVSVTESESGGARFEVRLEAD